MGPGRRGRDHGDPRAERRAPRTQPDLAHHWRWSCCPRDDGCQGSLLAQGAPKLEFSPFTFKLAYRCQSASCRGHEQSIVDWEISEAWRNWRRSYPTDYLDRIEEKWLSLVDPARLPALYVGNQHQAPQGFLVLGIARDVTPVEPTPVGPGPGDTAPRSSDGRSTDPPRSTEGRLFDL